MKMKMFFLTLSILFLFTACEKITENIPPIEPVNINDIQVPEDFTYETCSDVTVQLFVTSPAEEPVQGINFEIYDAHPDAGGRLIAKGVTQDNGKYETQIIVPQGFTEVAVVSPEDTRMIPIINGELTFEYGDYTKLESPFNDPKGYNPHTKLKNYCLTFSGNDDYVNLWHTLPELNNATTFTVEGWANQASNSASEVIFEKYHDSTHDIVLCTQDGKIIIELGNGSDSYATWADYSTTISNNTWFHWAVVFNGTGGTNADRLKLYINGNSTPISLAFTGTIPATTADLSGFKVYLSARGDVANTYAGWSFDGYIDEVRFWTTARSGAQINSTYNKLIDPSTSGLVGYWRMDEGTGILIYDETSNDSGELFGCTWAVSLNGFDSDADGVTDNNDDYPMDNERAYDSYFPAENTYYTLAFEDKWPSKGDYDFNDILVHWNYTQVTNASNELVDIHGSFKLMAVGAGYHDGFGVQFPFVVGNYYAFNNHGDAHQYVDNGTTNAVVILFQDAFNLMQEAPGDPSTWINTVESESYITPAEFEFTYTLGTPIATTSLTRTPPYNPFIFPNDDRLKEIHLPDYAPTVKMAGSPHFRTYDDDSNESDRWFKTSNNLPWAINVADVWDYPIELSQITWAYLFFADWAVSGGVEHMNWYDSFDPTNIDENHIYTP